MNPQICINLMNLYITVQAFLCNTRIHYIAHAYMLIHSYVEDGLSI